MQLAGAGAAGTAIGALGFAEAEAQVSAHVKPFRLVQTKEARTTCPYCAVSCGMLVYAAPNKANKGKLEVVHIEGDADRVAELDDALARVGDAVLQGDGTMEWEYLLVTARKA